MNKLLCAAARLLLGALAVADTVVINFETLAAGSTVSSQYAALGVHFSTTPATDPQGMTHAGIDVTQAPAALSAPAPQISGPAPSSSPLTAMTSPVSPVLVEDTERGRFATARATTPGPARRLRVRNDRQLQRARLLPGHAAPRSSANPIRRTQGPTPTGRSLTTSPSPVYRAPAPPLLPFGLLRLARRRR